MFTASQNNDQRDKRPRSGFCRSAAVVALAVLIAFQGFSIGTAQAGLIATQGVVTPAADGQRARILAQFERAEMRQALVVHGVDPGEAQLRLAALSDAEISRIAGNIDEDPAGQGLIGIVLLAGLIGLIVLLFADVSGKKDVF